MKRLAALFLLICIVGSNFSRFFIYAGFELNKKYIATTLCENRDKPWLHCNGKCYFMKKIKQAEDRDKSEERQSQKNHIQETFFESASNIKFHTYLLQYINTPYVGLVPLQVDKVIFHPPQIG
jgi:hypothetical protein